MEPHDIYIDSEALDTYDDMRLAKVPKEARSAAMRFGLAVTYDDVFGWRVWTPSLVPLLWTHLTAPDLRVVGWDVLEYDLPMIRHAAQARVIPATLDLSAQIKAATNRAYKLNTVARTNLGRGKVMDTRTVIEWLRRGDYDSMSNATAHCRNNVQLVIDLYELIRHGQPLTLPGLARPNEKARSESDMPLRIWFTPDGEWLRYEDLRGHVLSTRQQTA